MTKTNNAKRGGHLMKSPEEKSRYFQGIGKKQPGLLKRTYKKENSLHTNTPDTPEDGGIVNYSSRPPSRSLKVKDFFVNYWHIIVSVILSVIFGGGFITLLISNNREIGELKMQMGGLSEDIKNIQSKYELSSAGVSSNDNSLELLRLEIRKDTEFLKERVSRIEKRFSL